MIFLAPAWLWHRARMTFTHDELAGDADCLFVHAIGTDVLLNLALAMDPHGRQVVEDEGEVAIHQRPDLLGQFALHSVDMVHQRIHRPKQMLVGYALRYGRHRHRFQPAQNAQLAVRGAEPVEHHGPHKGLDIDLTLARAQRAPQGTVEAEIPYWGSARITTVVN